VDLRVPSKLNWLQHNLPEGLIVDAAWLERHGYYTALRSKYAAQGRLELVARGVYRRHAASLSGTAKSQSLRWQNVVISLQMLLKYPVHIGGRTAFEVEGFAHRLTPARLREIHLYGAQRPPSWLSRLTLDAPFIFRSAARLFEDSQSDIARASFKLLSSAEWERPVVISTPERAILELLDEVPRHETFRQADVLVKGLHNLSPRRLHTLLAACRSIKVKRLFLWFAERHNHAWLKALSRKNIDLGRGRQMLVRGGKLDPRFNITVPEALDPGA